MYKDTWTLWWDFFRRINNTKIELKMLPFWDFTKRKIIKQQIKDLQQELQQAGYTCPLSKFQSRYEQEMEIQRAAQAQYHEERIKKSKILTSAQGAIIDAIYQEVFEVYKDVYGVKRSYLTVATALEIKKLLKQAGRIIPVKEILETDIAEGRIKHSFELALRQQLTEKKDKPNEWAEIGKEISMERTFQSKYRRHHRAKDRGYDGYEHSR